MIYPLLRGLIYEKQVNLVNSYGIISSAGWDSIRQKMVLYGRRKSSADGQEKNVHQKQKCAIRKIQTAIKEGQVLCGM